MENEERKKGILFTEESGKHKFTTKMEEAKSEEEEEEYHNVIWNNRVEEYLAN